jgi:hypothetical protein
VKALGKLARLPEDAEGDGGRRKGSCCEGAERQRLEFPVQRRSQARIWRTLDSSSMKRWRLNLPLLTQRWESGTKKGRGSMDAVDHLTETERGQPSSVPVVLRADWGRGWPEEAPAGLLSPVLTS